MLTEYFYQEELRIGQISCTIKIITLLGKGKSCNTNQGEHKQGGGQPRPAFWPHFSI